MSSAAVGTAELGPGPEPDRKRRRILDAGGPVEDDETARRKMRDAEVYKRGVRVGFDPDNVGDVKSCIKPMGYFAMKGDLPMMRWLYVNGADTRDVDLGFWFPMFEAARYGHLEACKWLFDHGAAKDVNRRTDGVPQFPNGRSPLYCAFDDTISSLCDTLPYRNLSRWLILNGALSKDDDSGELDVETMKQDLGVDRSWLARERKALLEWAVDLHRPRTSFLLFLSGALSDNQQHAPSTRRTVSPLQLLGGKPGILELIGDYVGFVLGREARIIRQLTEMLPKVFAELHVDADISGESSSGE